MFEVGSRRPVPVGPVVCAPRARAEAVKDALVREGLLDAERRIARDARGVLFPVRDSARAEAVARVHGAALAEAEMPARRALPTPYELMVEQLADAPPEVRAAAPRKWEKLGPVVVTRLGEVPPAWRERVAAALAEALGARCIVDDGAGVDGELREMQAARVVWGEDPVAEHTENGVRYRFDASRVMFSSGNVDERQRVARFDCSSETVVDMFAGIGYFALPLAVHAGAARVVALEKNPVSHESLAENARLNGVADVVEPWLGDNRDYPHEGFADRVHMGYFPGTATFLPKALALLKREGGHLHYHDAVERRTWRADLERRVREAAERAGRTARFLEVGVVKSYNPSHVHAVADVEIR